MSLPCAAAEWVHWEGAAALADLTELLRSEGYRPRSGSLDRIHEDYEDIRRCGDLLISTHPESPLVAAYAALTNMGTLERRDLVGGIRRALASCKAVKSIGRATAADQVVTVLASADLTGADTDRLEEDRWVVEILQDQPGGVASRAELQTLIDADPLVDSRNFKMGYSPLLEMVGSGAYGVRGAPIDLERIARVRPASRGPWAPWGRLDRARVWVQVRSRGEMLRARIPNDLLDLLIDGRQPLVSLTGSPLGSLWVDHHDIGVEWAHPKPPEWEGRDRSAVLEFDFVGCFARLLAGASTTEEPDPRFVDGCALHNGRWRAALRIDDSLASTRACPMPAAVDGLPGLLEGQAAAISSNFGDLTVTREPHAMRVQLPRHLELIVGGSLRIDLDRGRCTLTSAAPPLTQRDELAHAVGILEPTTLQWRVLGAALGLADAGQDDVARRFAERERFDLAELARTTRSLASTATDEDELTSDKFRTEGGQFVHQTSAGCRYAHREPGPGPLGLQWRLDPDPRPDPEWARIAESILRSWAASSRQPIRLVRSERGWELPQDPQSNLLDALDLVGRQSGEIPGTRPGEAQVPLTAFGARHSLAQADRCLEELEITPGSWTVRVGGILEEHATPLRLFNALLSKPRL